MGEPAVVNASPLIFLARGNLFHLLRLTGDRVVVPRVVAHEIRARGPTDPTVLELASNEWIDVVEPGVVPAVVQAWDLGPGESAVLSWAMAHAGTEAILDDLAARRCAAALGVPVRGTLGLVLLAKRRGAIPAARPILDMLREAGMYLSLTVMDRALRLVDE